MTLAASWVSCISCWRGKSVSQYAVSLSSAFSESAGDMSLSVRNRYEVADDLTACSRPAVRNQVSTGCFVDVNFSKQAPAFDQKLLVATCSRRRSFAEPNSPLRSRFSVAQLLFRSPFCNTASIDFSSAFEPDKDSVQPGSGLRLLRGTASRSRSQSAPMKSSPMNRVYPPTHRPAESTAHLAMVWQHHAP